MLTDILGQESVVAALVSALRSDKLAQTFLFTGEQQLGKTTTALALAKVLLCQRRTPDTFDSCDTCAACRSIDIGTNPDVRVVSPVGPSRMLRIAQFWPRDGVKDHPADKAMLRDLHFAPVSGKRRIFVIDSADTMNDDTANSLLKVLEEPPAYAVFILTALSAQAVLPTILSRSQALRFKAVPESKIVSELTRRGVSAASAAILAAYAQGKPGVALKAAAAKGVFAGRDDILDCVSQVSGGQHPLAAYRLADEFRKASAKLVDLGGSEEDSGARTLLTNACELLLSWYRDILVRRTTNFKGRIVNADRIAIIDAHASSYKVGELEIAIEIIQDSRRYIGRNANAQLATECLMLRLLNLKSGVDRSITAG